jgi:tetratricopeptide (TPR) repeat protein
MNGPLSAFERAFDELQAALPELLSTAAVEEHTSQQSKSLHKQNQQKLTHEIYAELETLRRRCRNGLSLILQQLHAKQEAEIFSALPRLEQELEQRLYHVLSSPSFTQIILRVVSGETWKEALRLSDEAMKLLYEGAKEVFEEGRFEDATDCFCFLSWFDARQYDFWMALGHSQFHCANHGNAISSYGVASQCAPTESWPHIYAATCFEALEDFDQATQALTEGLEAERRKASPDKGLLFTLEHKLEQYRRGSVTPIS